MIQTLSNVKKNHSLKNEIFYFKNKPLKLETIIDITSSIFLDLDVVRGRSLSPVLKRLSYWEDSSTEMQECTDHGNDVTEKWKCWENSPLKSLCQGVKTVF